MEAGTRTLIFTSRGPGLCWAGLHSTKTPSSSCAHLSASAECTQEPGQGFKRPGQNNGRYFLGAGLAAWVRRAASCLALGAALLRSHFTLSPQFLLAGSQESWETVLVSFSLGDELSRSLPFSGSQFPPQWNQVSSSAASPTPPLRAALTDTDFLEQSTTFGKEVV